MSVGTILARAFTGDTLACSHCGSSEIYPYPGLYGELGGLLGRVRYTCCSCRRNSWLSPDAEVPQGPLEEYGLETPRLALREMSLDDLDFVAAMLGHPEVMRFYPKVYSRDEARE